MSLVTQVASGLGWIMYGSFFEWYWHKYWMHYPRFPKQAFEGHTLTHHVLYKGNDEFFLPENEHGKHILLKPYALPAMVLSHLPIVLLIEHFLPGTAIGALTATILYFVVYEYMHWNMHVPRGHFVERFGWFQFIRQHHKLHHKYMQKNFCVLFPLADWVCGTMVTEKSLAQQRATREAAIARGDYNGVERKKRRRIGQRGLPVKGIPRVKLSRLASMRLAKLEKMAQFGRKADVRRGRGARKLRNKNDIRELLHTFTNRKDRDSR